MQGRRSLFPTGGSKMPMKTNTLTRKSMGGEMKTKKTKLIGKPLPPKLKGDIFNPINIFIQSKCGVAGFPSRVKSMTTENYKQVVTLLLKLIDKDFCGFAPGTKIDHIFRELLDYMGYPYDLRQSDLQTIGNNQTSSLSRTLYPLYWLTRLIELDEEYAPSTKEEPSYKGLVSRSNNDSLHNEKGEIEKDLKYRLVFFRFLRTLYERWLLGGDEAVNPLEYDMTTAYSNQNRSQKEEVSKIEKLLEEKQEEYNEVCFKHDDRRQIADKIRELEQNKISKTELLKQKALARDECEIKFLELQKTVEAEKRKSDELDKQLMDLDMQLKNRAINPDQINGIFTDTHEKELLMYEYQQKNNNCQERINKCEDELKVFMDALNSLINDWNESAPQFNAHWKANFKPENYPNIFDVDIDEAFDAIEKQFIKDNNLIDNINSFNEEKEQIEQQIKQITEDIKSVSKQPKNTKESKGKDISALQQELDSLIRQDKRDSDIYSREREEKLRGYNEASEKLRKFKEHVANKLQYLNNEISALHNSV